MTGLQVAIAILLVLGGMGIGAGISALDRHDLTETNDRLRRDIDQLCEDLARMEATERSTFKAGRRWRARAMRAEALLRRFGIVEEESA